MKPAAMKEGKLYSQQPHSGAGDFTFSRANGVQTRINEHGLIEAVADNTPRLSYDLVTKEGARTNLIDESINFTTWGDTGITVTADDTVAPDGSQTADKLVSTGNNWRRNKVVTGISNGVDHTFSVFVKIDEDSPYSNNHITQLEIYRGASGLVCQFDLINKTFPSNTGLSDPFIESYPNGWFRIGGTYTADGSTNYTYVYPSQQYGVSGSMYFWGAQLESGSQATEFILTDGETTTIPAVVVASECPTLLLEPTGTNIITQSRELTSGDLAKANLTVSDNKNIIDPTGKTYAKTLTATSTSQPRLEWRGTSVPSSNTNYAMSFFVRYNTARYVAIGHFSQTGEYAIFDLVDGKVEVDTGTQTAKIEAHPNGWYRVSKSFEVLSTASLNYWKFTLCTRTAPFVGVSGEKADVFGLQFEASSRPTSYIPTEGSTEVRNVDTANVANFSGMPTDYPLTVFWEGEVESIGSNQAIFGIHKSGSAVDYLKVSWTSAGFIQVERRRTTQDVDSITHSIAVGDNKKVAISFTSATAYKIYIDGNLLRNETSGTNLSWDFDSVVIGTTRVTSDTGFRNSCKNLALFNEALSDSELITLTT